MTASRAQELGDQITIAIGDLVPMVGNGSPRATKEEDAELLDSIKKKGVIQSLTVRADPAKSGKYQVICGHRRLAAATAAGLSTVPAIVKKLNDEEAREYNLIENVQRADLHPLIEADLLGKLVKREGAKELAARLGKTVGHVARRLALLSLCPEARKVYAAGDMSHKEAQLVARMVSHEDQKRLVREVRWRGDTDQQTEVEEMAESLLRNLKAAPFALDDATLDARRSCADCPSASMNHPELFPELANKDRKGDAVCADARCFQAKINAHSQRLLDAGKKEGVPVLSARESKAAFSSGHLMSRSGWLDLDEKLGYEHVDYGEPPAGQLRELLKKTGHDGGPEALAADDNGRVHRLVKRLPALDRLYKAKLLKKPTRASEGGSSHGQSKREPERAQLCKATAEFAVGRILQKVTSSFDEKIARALAETMAGSAPSRADDSILKRRLAGNTQKSQITLHTLIRNERSLDGLLGWIVELAIAGSDYNGFWDRYSGYAPGLKKLAAVFNLDIPKLEAEVKALQSKSAGGKKARPKRAAAKGTRSAGPKAVAPPITKQSDLCKLHGRRGGSRGKGKR